MKFKQIAQYLEGIPYTQKERGKLLYDHIITKKPNRCLELGFAHGVATCYMAAALHELGSGIVTAVDLESSKGMNPNLEHLLESTGLEDFCEINREKNSYTWFLEKEIERNTKDNACKTAFDFCFIDGAKNWTIDGFAFFLVDKLLNENGWILFDDYQWTYSAYSKQILDGIIIRELSEDQASTPNIKLIFNLLVMQHPNYSRFMIDEDWAWAQKIVTEEKIVKIMASQSFKYRLLKKIRRLKK